jgi:signal transduction histidine kinase
VLQEISISVASGVLLGALFTAAWQRRQTRRLRAAELRAQNAERLAEIGSMTAGLAHEIKNPLSTLSLNAQLLSENVDEIEHDLHLKPRLQNRVAALRRETDRLRGILQDFLDYAGNLRLERITTNLASLCQDLGEFLSPQAEHQGVRLRVDTPDPKIVAPVDQRLLKQAILNLMLNAIQAIASGRGPAQRGETRGEVIVRLSLASAPGAKVSVARISVIDTGPGISAENLHRIFQPYFTTKAGGTGLGLPTAKRYILAHQGTLTVTSEPGKGTAFTIDLPLTAVDDAEASTKPA